MAKNAVNCELLSNVTTSAIWAKTKESGKINWQAYIKSYTSNKINKFAELGKLSKNFTKSMTTKKHSKDTKRIQKYFKYNKPI